MATPEASNSRVKGREKFDIARTGALIIHCLRALKARWASNCQKNWSFLSNEFSIETS